ncbi:MAG: peptidoglycan-binding protein [Clostridiales bacterium]|nr:peptidoglycan-binding protein [Clostridiales bacterium]
MSSVIYRGIDVSKWQGAVDWEKAAASGIKFAIIRAGYGSSTSQKDPKFETNYAGAKAAGLLVGVYWYSYATTTSGAKAEAETCLECVGDKELDLPIYFDQEYEAKILALTTAKRTSICKKFASVIEAAGYLPGIYASSSWFKSQLNAEELTSYSIWAAQYASSCTCPVSYDIWQYSSSGSVSGVSGRCDMNYMYNLPGSTDNTSETNTTTETTTTTGGFDVSTLSTLKNGSSGAEVTSLQALLKVKESKSSSLSTDGLFGSKTESAVERYQTAQGLTVDGICGQNTWTAILTT